MSISNIFQQLEGVTPPSQEAENLNFFTMVALG